MTRFNSGTGNGATNASLNPSPAETEVNLVGQPCGHHGQYTFYKAFSYRNSPDAPKRVLMLGEFFFVRISPHDDPCIGELQLLWQDHQRNQLLSSTRLYFLPEQTPDGRLSQHGQHEVLAAHDKVVLKLTDLVSWITHKVDWITGLPYEWHPSEDLSSQSGTDYKDVALSHSRSLTTLGLSSSAFLHNQNVIPKCGSEPFLTTQRYFSSLKIRLKDKPDSDSSYSRSFASSRVDFSDIIPLKIEANESQSDLSTVVVLSYQRYCRYRALLKRIEGQEQQLLRQSIVQSALTELGIPLQRRTRVNILFCRDTFNHEALLNNDLNCDHLAPKLKGRPRKRPVKQRSTVRASSPESISSEENAQVNGPRRSRRTAATASTLATASLINGTAALIQSSTGAGARRKPTKKSKASSKKPKLTKAKSEDELFVPKSTSPSKSKSKVVTKESGNRSECSGNDTSDDGSNSSVDANNNHKPAVNVNQELKERCTANETIFIKELHRFMKHRKTPISRLPNLGFKKNLYLFYTRAQQHGGYDQITRQKSWKKLYIGMGGDWRNTSAATCTRRHYERLLLPFERHLNGLPDKLPKKKAAKLAKDEDLDLENEDMDEDMTSSSEEDDKVTLANQNEADKNDSSRSSGAKPIKENGINHKDELVESEQVILKFAPSQISKAKKSKLSDPPECELSISIKDQREQKTKPKSLTSDDVQLFATCGPPREADIRPFGSSAANKRDLIESNSESVTINVVNGEGPKRTKREPIEDSVTITPTSAGSGKSLFHSSSLSKDRHGTPPLIFSKMAAMFNVTPRSTPKSEDVYDFTGDEFEAVKTGREVLLLKSSNRENHDPSPHLRQQQESSPTQKLVSPLHSISTLVNKMGERSKSPAKVPTAATPPTTTPSSTSASKPTKSSPKTTPLPSVSIQNSLVQRVFSLPKPLESPNQLLLSLKNNKKEMRPKEPLPAHSNNTKVVLRKEVKQLKRPVAEFVDDEILDLSMKKRCREADSRSSPSQHLEPSVVPPVNIEGGMLLDLSTKNKLELNVSLSKHLSKTPMPIKSDFTRVGSDKAHSHQSSKTNAAISHFNHAAVRREANLTSEKSANQMPKARHVLAPGHSAISQSNTSRSQLHNGLIKNTQVTEKKKVKPQAATSTSCQVKRSTPDLLANKPAITEYNPQLPSFIGSLQWPNWSNPLLFPPYTNAPQFSASSGGLPSGMANSAAAAANLSNFFTNQQLMALTGLSSNASDASPQINPLLAAAGLFDHSKLIQDAYQASHQALLENLAKQNLLLNGNGASLPATFANMFASSK